MRTYKAAAIPYLYWANYGSQMGMECIVERRQWCLCTCVTSSFVMFVLKTSRSVALIDKCSRLPIRYDGLHQ